MRDGRLNKCKECAKKDVKINYIVNKDYYKEYDKERDKTEKRRSMRKEYAKNNPEKIREIKRRWARKNKHKRNAQSKARRAVLSGLLVKPNKCSKCGNKAKIEAHHEDYNKPLDVIWLCNSCHTKEHYKSKLSILGASYGQTS